MVKSLVSKLQGSSNLSLAQTFGIGGAEETNYAKHRNDPGRFFGDGVQFKAKLIGILEVGEARGDRMCQEALQDLKMAIRAAGEHKQRIIIHVTIDGLRLRDEKTSDSLYHHPVHKISFIAQDMTDSRAFGYIFGSPDSGHRFFGIKTDKAASQVVLAMRDLFQVVFELKKKEIEMARQQIQGKALHDHASQLANLSSLKSGHSELAAGGSSSSSAAAHAASLSMLGGGAASNGVSLTRLGVNLDVAKTSGAAAKEISPESVADLVDLEQELTSLQRGISQMERITPNEPNSTQQGLGMGLAKSASEDDPFGDSFIYVPSYNILPPPPESGRTRHKQTSKTPENQAVASALDAMSTLLSPAGGVSGSPATLQADNNDDDSWLHDLQQQHDVFDTTKVSATPTPMSAAAVLGNLPIAPLAARESSATPTQQISEQPPVAASTSNSIEVGLSALGSLTAETATAAGEGATTMTTTTTAVMSENTTALEEHQDASNPVLLPRDTDPFSPTRKKSDPDPFQEGDLFAKLDAFEFDTPQASNAGTSNVFNGPLQVQLPPEQQQQQQEGWQADISRLEPAPVPQPLNSSVRHRPTPVASVVNVGGPLDVISSISNKKMPHLFGQARFSKRGDSSGSVGSSVNMRRLQESDSLSENEAAPEPPPRPDSTPYAEPPPLPPKKQFSDLVIRPTPAVAPPVGRYEYLNHASNQMRRSVDAPPIPLPSRRVGRSDGNFPGPGRPRKPGHTEDDYLAPLGGTPPPLLPPPTQTGSSRARPQRQASLGRPQDIYENKAEILQAAQAAQAKESAAAALAPDITLTQLLTLGMDELAVKLNVPASKLSTMTLVQLTAYLSEYLQSSNNAEQPKSRASPAAVPLPSPGQAPVANSSSTSAVFKVNFDQQTSFVAKFDDTFGEDLAQEAFVANFANFNEAPTLAAPAVPSADRYAVFREIIDQELQQQQQETDLMGDLTPPPVDEVQQEQQQHQQQQHQQQQQQPQLELDVIELELEQPPPKIDTKITEVVAQAKDRYAALRDIILVENLFVKPPPSAAPAVPEKDLLQDLFSDEFNEDQDIRQIMDSGHDRRGLVDSRGLPAEPSSSALTVADDDDDDDEDAGGESSMDSNEKDAEPVSAQDQYEKLSTSADKPEFKTEEQLPPKQDNKFLTVVSGPSCVVAGAGRDDIEIDELMQRAISNLSLDSRDRISPATSSAAPSRGPPHSLHTPSQFNDVSTSPIPLQKSPAPILNAAGVSPVPSQLSAVSQLIDTATKQIQSERDREKPSWATFDSPKVGTAGSIGKGKARLTLPPPPASNTSQQDTAESPCSSDPRDDGGGWSKQQQQRRWAKKERQQTSSSSRDLSPWDDDTPEYLKQQRRGLPPPSQLPPHPPAHGYYMRHARRLNSCDEDYDYDAEFCARRDREQPQRKFKQGLSRSRDNFDLDSPSWYHHPAHHTWSPQEIEQGVRARSFERSAYERSSYGPPAPMYDKRGQPLPRDRERERERSKYREREYRERNYERPGYDFDYENVYDERRSPMGYKARPEYLYERDRDRERERERERKSFDRESVESFESSSRRRRSFGSGGDVYGSLDSRDDYRERDRELKTRSLRKPATSSAKLRVTGDIDYEQDSEQDFQRQRSLQRPSQLGGDVVPGAPQRLRKSSGSSPWDGEEPALPGQKSWKRPASAAETERRLAESRRAAALAQTPSDGEKDRRFRKKTRARSAKDLASVGVRYGSGRGVRDNYDYISCGRNDDDDDEDYVDDEPPTDEDKFERLNRRRHEMHQRMLETERRQLERHAPSLAKLPGQNRARGGGNGGGVNSDYGFVDSYEQTPTPRSNASSTAVMMSGGESSAGVGGKFNFDDGFESDFNQSSPPPAPAGTASSCNSTPAGLISASSTVGSKSLFRFSNDFSEREKLQQQQLQQQQQRDNFELETPPTSTPPITQKLRFDDNVKVSQFDDAAFEDDFAKASFDFDKEQSSPAAPSTSSRKQNMRSSKLQQRQELIKKSESVNIFAKKQEDPFEDDEFFKSPDEQPHGGKDEDAHDGVGGDGDGDADANKFQWNEDNNFAKFDENM